MALVISRMVIRFFTCVGIFLLLQYTSGAQTVLSGKIFSKDSPNGIRGATVRNQTRGISAVSGASGAYKIVAGEKDLVTFSFIGFEDDSVRVEQQLLLSGYDAYLSERTVTLDRVVVSGNYEQDSIERRKWYQDIYENQPTLTGGNGPTDGFGISISPFSYFSKNARQKRRLKKNLEQQEKDAYVDYVFPAFWVSSLTGLKGDSLNLFLYKYRPSYKFCRKSDRTDLIVYVNDKFKEFTNPVKKKN